MGRLMTLLRLSKATDDMLGILKKVLILVIGVPITIIGLILIPVPGPGGLPLTFLGLLILSLEFDWAKKYLDQIKAKFRKLLADARARADSINNK